MPKNRNEEPLDAWALPYDPEKWEQRLEEAAKSREKVLRERMSATARATPALETTAEPKPSFWTWRTLAIGSTGVAIFCVGLTIGVVVMAFPRPDTALGSTVSAPIVQEPGTQTVMIDAATVTPPIEPPVASMVPAALPTDDAAALDQPPVVMADIAAEAIPVATPVDVASAIVRPDMYEIVAQMPVPTLPAPVTDFVARVSGVLEEAADPPEPAVPEFVIQAPLSVEDETRDALLAKLRGEGFALIQPGAVNLTITQTHLRYFHPGDRAAAEEAALLLDAPARDFTEYRPSPRAGLIEVWMEGQSSGAASQRATRNSLQPDPVRTLARGLRGLLNANN